MSDDEEKCPPCKPGAPAWLGTFADLMSLLMCFFVLLLSFSEMDAMKFKRLAGSMAQAFGVQNKLKLKDVPKGTSIIAQEFSPGRPEPTPINEIYQKTDDLTELSLDVECSEEYEVEAGRTDLEAGAQKRIDEVAETVAELIRQTQQDATDIAKALTEQIANGEVEVQTKGRQIIVRIREKGSFTSGSATLQDKYIPLLHEVRNVLLTKEGMISVQGHTDDIPINTARFRSNWELSTARAVSVAHELLSGDVLDPHRIFVAGYADTQPIAPNTDAAGRAKNRRVEIVVEQGINEDLKEDLQVLKEEDPELYKSFKLEDAPVFKLRPNEIF